nr:hypothetical protein [Prevotella sp.]
MNKILRISMIAVLALIANFSFGQTVFNFDNDYKTLFPDLPGVSSSTSKDGDFTKATTCTVDGIKVTISKKTSGSNENRIWASSPRLRMYSGTMTIEAPEGKKISDISFEQTKWAAKNKSDVGTLTVGKWKGDANKVVITIGANTQLKSLTVTLAGTVITYTDVPSVKDLLANYTKDTPNLNLKLTNAKVIYVNEFNGTVNTYVREGDAAIELRTLGFDMPVNSTISGTVKVNYAVNYGVPYLKANDATNDESLTIQESTEEAQPIVATVADIVAKKYINDLVIIKDVKFTKESVTSGTSTRTNYYINDGDQKVQLYDKFQVSDLATLTDGETYTVQGLFGQIFKDVPEILMTKKVAETTGINNITTDATLENAPAFNLAGQKVGKAYKGVVIKAGKKFVQK